MKSILKLYLAGAALIGAFILGTLVPFVSDCLKRYVNVKEWNPAYDPKEPNDLARLRRLGYQATPLLEAIKEFQAEHGVTPEFSQLKDSPRLTVAYRATCLNVGGGWAYIRQDERNFRLYLKLNWDAMIRYDSATHVWKYDLGDGTGPITIEL